MIHVVLIYFRLYIIQNGHALALLHWDAAAGVLKKVYKADSPGDWSGIYWPGNTSQMPTDSPQCGWNGELCQHKDKTNIVTSVIFLVVGSILLLILAVGYKAIRYTRNNIALKEIHSLFVDWENIKDTRITSEVLNNTSTWVTEWKGDRVFIKLLGIKAINLGDRKVLLGLTNLLQLNHENLICLIGICSKSPHACMLMEYAHQGSIQHILAVQEVNLDLHFKLSILFDIAKGMRYIHDSKMGFHGSLTSAKCVINSRWVCKITGHGLHMLQETKNKTDVSVFQLLWAAPELLNNMHITGKEQLQKADVYSYGIICYELMMETLPYSECMPELAYEKAIEKVRDRQNPPYRPNIDNIFDLKWKALITHIWQDRAEDRPHFSQILASLIKLNKGKQVSLVDNMIYRLEVYTNDLEDKVADRIIGLNEEKKKVEILLSELLPGSVAQTLIQGKTVTPETFSCVTIFFSDIVGFTQMCSKLDPIHVVHMMNSMYTMFDDTIRQFDVYKVATIGDAYMAASGVPVRNCEHAIQMCEMALSFMDAAKQFSVPMLPTFALEMRVGIHSGPCVAGVVGIKMPRYLLFGTTVDIASKMESEGEAKKIQISEVTESLIRGNSKFVTAKKMVLISTFGHIQTYLLCRG